MNGAHAMFGASGAALSAEVPPNPYNTLADQLAQKEQQLNDREAAMNAQAAKPSFLSSGNLFGFISFLLSLILCALLALNFYLDAKRGKKGNPLAAKYSVDLS
jgi:hypothetical protein